jgi:alanine racemase
MADAGRVQARVNVAAIRRNCARLCTQLHGGAVLCAVVKADGYGHGAVASARAALAGGARWLAVADAGEARELREAGLREVPLLVMGALTPEGLAQALAADACGTRASSSGSSRSAAGACTSSSTPAWDAWAPATPPRPRAWPTRPRAPKACSSSAR